MIKSWDYLNYYKKNKKEIIKLVDKVFSSGNLILGPEVEKLEKNFSKFIGSKFAVGVGNCTDAIYISLKALKTISAAADFGKENPCCSEDDIFFYFFDKKIYLKKT